MLFLSPKGHRIFAVFMLILALFLAIGVLGMILIDKLDNAVDKKFTLKNYKMEDALFFYVAEEDKPLIVSTRITNKYIDKESLAKLQPNDILDCKVIDGFINYSYEIVQLVVDGNVIFSLDDARTSQKVDDILGLVLVSIGAVFCLVASILLFYRAKHGYSEKSELKTKQQALKLLTQNIGMSEREKNMLIKAIDSADLSDDLPCGKQELKDKFTSSFYTRNNKEYTTAMQYMTNQGCCKVFRETLSTILSNGELRVCYDAGDTENGSIFVLYKVNGKIIDGYLLKNDETGKFEIDELNMSSEIYGKVKLNKTEKRQFIEKLQEYNRLKEDIFDIAVELFI